MNSSRKPPLSGRPAPSHRRALVILAALLAGCSTDDPAAPIVPEEPNVIDMCQQAGGVGTIVTVPASQVAPRRQRGEYVTRFEVDPSKAPVTDSIHFRRLTDALDVARSIRTRRNESASAACRITIVVASGTLRGTAGESTDPVVERLPFVIDMPDITVTGALQVRQDREIAVVPLPGDTTTRIVPSPALAVIGAVGNQPGLSQPIFVVNGRADGSGGHRAIIEGFSMASGHPSGDAAMGGQGILALRARGLIVRSNQFTGNFTERIDLRASDGVVERNVSSGVGNSCDFCLAGPGTYTARFNRLADGGIPGIYVSPTVILPVPSGIDQYVLPADAEVNAVITKNIVETHQRRPVGTGLRLSSIGVGAPNVRGKVNATMRENTLTGNTFGIILEAGFPVAGTTLRGDITAVIENNIISGSCQAPLLVSFSRHTTGLGLATAPYLQNSSIAVQLTNPEEWDQTAWFAHVPNQGNTLTVNARNIAPGNRTAYNANGCPNFGSARAAEASDSHTRR